MVTILPVLAESVTINQSDTKVEIEELELHTGDTEYIYVVIQPENTTDKTVVWSSSDERVIMLEQWLFNESGDFYRRIQALNAGTATITATRGDVSATCKVTVIGDETGIDEVIADKDGEYTVYTVSGIFLFKTKDIAAIENLDPGLYIINSKTVLIR